MDFSFSPITETRFDEACVTSLEPKLVFSFFFFFFFYLDMRGNSQTIYTVRINHPANGTRLRASGSRWATIKVAAYIIIVCSFFFQIFMNVIFWMGVACHVHHRLYVYLLCIRKTCSAAGSQIISLLCICNSADSAWRNSSRHRKDTARHIGTIVRIVTAASIII
jgi:hypothetical protein